MDDFRVESAAPNPVLRVLIFSDTRFLSCALAEMLAHEVSVLIVGVATDLREVQLICQEHDPDLILFDLGLPNGSAAIRELRKSVPGARVTALDLAKTETNLIAWAEARITNYLSVSAGLADLITAIQSIMRSEQVRSSRVETALSSHTAARKPINSGEGYDANLPNLTVREGEILNLIRNGFSNKEIARTLRIGESTAKSHVHNLLVKLNLTRRGQAAAWAQNHGSQPGNFNSA